MPRPVLYGRGVSERYLHDDVGEQVPHSLHSIHVVVKALVHHRDGPAEQCIPRALHDALDLGRLPLPEQYRQSLQIVVCLQRYSVALLCSQLCKNQDFPPLLWDTLDWYSTMRSLGEALSPFSSPAQS